MSTFATSSTAEQACCVNPTKHVRYTHGMILGVRDFEQEFGYHNARDRWLARDLVGYGVVTGLEVQPKAADNAVIEVAAGVAVCPSGQWVRVDRAQCADLREWLKGTETKQELAKRFAPGVTTAAIELSVVLGYRDCPTDAGAVPGEPCRSEEEWQQPLRLQDSFLLELAWTAPLQEEEDALRGLVDWLKRLPLVETTGATTSLKDFLAELEKATSKPLPFPPPGSPLRIPAGSADLYWRSALQLWTSKLRAVRQGDWWPEGPCCGGTIPTPGRTAPEERLLLAKVTVPLARNALSGDWELNPALKAAVEIGRRPLLSSQRLLLEWILNGPTATGGAVGVVRHPPGLPGLHVVAAGLVGGSNTVPTTDATYNNLQIVAVSGAQKNQLKFTFGDYDASAAAAGRYGVQITPLASDAELGAITMVPPASVRSIAVSLVAFAADGFVVRVSSESGDPIPFDPVNANGILNGVHYSVQVTRFDP